MNWLVVFGAFGLVAAENGLDGWLRYAPLSSGNGSHGFLPSSIVALNANETSSVYVAGREIQRGLNDIFGKQVDISHQKGSNSAAVIISTLEQYSQNYANVSHVPELEGDGFWISTEGETIQILGNNERGALYGAFEYLSMLAQGNFSQVSYATNPAAPIRWVNQWDNMDGSIERGYGGASIFFANNQIVSNLTRAAQYARLLASIRVNAVIVNNVNANPNLLTAQNMDGLARIADVFRPYGVQLGISLNFASPQTLGGLGTFDPLDSSVISWWANITNQLYHRIPDMAGYLIKANSEGQPGPLTYNRTLAQGANLFADALKPHGGIVMFRAFVYNQLNQSVWTADRAKAAVEFFKELDGEFDDNVVIQIKYGPVDFQVREPPSPLFAHLLQTGSAIELQITQEYLGQQNHLVYLPPLWKTILDYDLRVDGQQSLVSDIVAGKRFNRRLGGYAGVVNVGTNTTWLGSHLAMSNLYTYGRLAWNPREDPEGMLKDWIRLTFGDDQTVIDTITDISMDSWPAYEQYSGNLGIQTLTDILYTHYGPNPASHDNNGWGQWTRADTDSIGMDRTVSNGTGFSGQYPPEIAGMYENIETTPDDLVLWFHHVPYTHTLHSGKTVIQHFYDSHYLGAETAQTFPVKWAALKGKIDDERHSDVAFRLTYQAGHSIVWRDAINYFYYNLSGIADTSSRLEDHPYRLEAESMTLSGYKSYSVHPPSTASNFRAIVTETNKTTGTASAVLDRFSSGTYDIAINYYDQYGGQSRWQLSLNNVTVGEWKGDHEGKLGNSPSIYLDGHSATRITFPDVTVRQGDTLRIVGIPDGVEAAPLDYVAILPKGVVD